MDQKIYTSTPPGVNVRPRERVLSIIAGSMLILSSFKGKKFNIIKVAAGGYLLYRGLRGHCAAYAALGKKKLPDPVNNILISTTVRVKRPRDEVYAFWRQLKNLPLFMTHLASVEELSDIRSRWKAHFIGKVGTIKWDADITREVKDYLIEWTSLPGSSVENAGKIVFEDAEDHETDIHAVITYTAPMGAPGDFMAKLLLNPVIKTIINEDISNVKRYMETGERATVI